MATMPRLQRSTPSLTGRNIVLFANGAFLALMGGSFAVFDLLSFYWGRGPLGDLYHEELLTVGLFEAHGLALILGVLLVRAARQPTPPAVWHLVGASIHTLLGTANLIFWSLFLVWDVVTAEIVVTSIHWLFVLVQLTCYIRARSAHGSLA